MIKRISFAPGDAGAGAGVDAWRAAVDGLADAPPDARPARVAVCTSLPDLTDGEPEHHAIGLEWFTDVAQLDRYDAWTGPGGAAARGARRVLVADEVVLRGADWLERRWRQGGAKVKHMAFASRAVGLTAAEFSERWKRHAGSVGRAGASALVVPDHARGQAYVQNHPLPRSSGDWAYDAVNEVYFDDVDGLRARIDWFRENVDPTADDLFRASWFLAVREDVLFAGP
ncbi:MAG TPA: hypothetical protein VEP49_00640 [Acidimicrobiia bacterium]|nr:hypothetical protein [Acidimicrobiia bacterium]